MTPARVRPREERLHLSASPLEITRPQPGTEPDVVERLCAEYGGHLLTVRSRESGDGDHPALHRAGDVAALRLALIAHKRAAVVRLRDERCIDDTVLRQTQARPDIEEVRVTPTTSAD